MRSLSTYIFLCVVFSMQNAMIMSGYSEMTYQYDADLDDANLVIAQKVRSIVQNMVADLGLFRTIRFLSILQDNLLSMHAGIIPPLPSDMLLPYYYEFLTLFKDDFVQDIELQLALCRQLEEELKQ